MSDIDPQEVALSRARYELEDARKSYQTAESGRRACERILDSKDKQIKKLQNELVLARAAADAAGHKMLELQQQCIKLQKLVTELESAKPTN